MKPRKEKFVKASITKLATTRPTPGFSKGLHRLRSIPSKAKPGPKAQKRGNIFSQSHAPRVDGGIRKLKTKQNTKLLFHICAML